MKGEQPNLKAAKASGVYTTSTHNKTNSYMFHESLPMFWSQAMPKS